MAHKDRLDIVAGEIDKTSRLVANLPKCRETSMVLTKLDEARLWLKEIPEHGAVTVTIPAPHGAVTVTIPAPKPSG